jgi:hypothetical protein
MDNRSGLDGTSSTTSQLPGIGLSCEGHPGDADDGRDDKISPKKHLSDGCKGVLSDTLGPKGLIASRQLVEESQIPLSGCRGQPMAETTLCSPCGTSQVRVLQSKEAHAHHFGTH